MRTYILDVRIDFKTFKSINSEQLLESLKIF